MLHGSGKGACMGYSSKSFSGWMYMFCSLGGGGWGGGGYYLQDLVAFSVVDWLSDHLLVGRSQKENAADLRDLLVTFFSKMTLYRRCRRATLWCMCATALRAGSRSLGGVADDVIFPIRVVGPSKMGLLPVQVSNLVMAAVMASLLLSFWSRVVSFDPCPLIFGFDESDSCSFGPSRRKSAGSYSASACPGRLLSSNCGGLLGAGSWSRRSGLPSADSWASNLLFFLPELFQAAPTAPLARV